MADMFTQPAPDAVGWCHSCETHQRGHHAVLREMRWSPGLVVWSCINCPDEPWDWGVWDVTDRADWATGAACADALCVSYGPCGKHGSDPTPGEPAR